MRTATTFDKCPTCKKWGFIGSHRCPPRFFVRIDDEWHKDEDPSQVFADDAENAAIEFASEWDHRTDYDLCNGEELTVIVSRDSEMEAPQKFVVRGEYIPSYSASPADDL